MAELSCTECHKSIAEFALNILTGRERAEILTHLEQCDDCRERVADLALTADRLVDLLPDAEPPPGFAQRVANTLKPAPKPTRRLANAPVVAWTVRRRIADPGAAQRLPSGPTGRRTPWPP
jgi:hypothetical protein